MNKEQNLNIAESQQLNIASVRRSAFKPHIWHTSPACISTFQDLINEINKLHERIDELETKLERKTS
jgi:hypothetical protein